MKKYTLIVALLAIVVLVVPAMAARQAVSPITHEQGVVFQSYPGISGGNLGFQGFAGPNGNTITATPGILWIIPQADGTPAWSNYVSAYQAGVPYTLKNVVLQKVVPPMIQCSDRYMPKTVTQQGTTNIRLWWPLMYEVPGTTWTLTITYGTPSWADPANPGFPSTVHQDIWTWKLDADLTRLSLTLALFHELPFGLCEMPLVSDEVLYPVLQEKLAMVNALILSGMYPEAGNLLIDFELEVADACITSCTNPFPTGPGTGITNTIENPACCKLMIDAEYIGFTTGIFQPTK